MQKDQHIFGTFLHITLNKSIYDGVKKNLETFLGNPSKRVENDQFRTPTPSVEFSGFGPAYFHTFFFQKEKILLRHAVTSDFRATRSSKRVKS